MTDDLTRRIYSLRILETDLQKEGLDHLLVSDVRVGQNGTLECNHVFVDSERVQKLFYNGKFFLEEFSSEEFEEIKNHTHDEE
ncbi:MAG: hypothetical protein ACREBR_05425 [bacterium]